MNNGIQAFRRFNVSERTLRKLDRANPAIRIEDFPTKLIRKLLDQWRAWNIQVFCHLVQIDALRAKRFQIAGRSRFTRSDVADNKNGEHRLLPLQFEKSRQSVYTERRAHKTTAHALRPNMARSRSDKTSNLEHPSRATRHAIGPIDAAQLRHRPRPAAERRRGPARIARAPSPPADAGSRPPVSGALLSHGLPPQYHRRGAA